MTFALLVALSSVLKSGQANKTAVAGTKDVSSAAPRAKPADSSPHVWTWLKRGRAEWVLLHTWVRVAAAVIVSAKVSMTCGRWPASDSLSASWAPWPVCPRGAFAVPAAVDFFLPFLVVCSRFRTSAVGCCGLRLLGAGAGFPVSGSGAAGNAGRAGPWRGREGLCFLSLSFSCRPLCVCNH